MSALTLSLRIARGWLRQTTMDDAYYAVVTRGTFYTKGGQIALVYIVPRDNLH